MKGLIGLATCPLPGLCNIGGGGVSLKCEPYSDLNV